MSEFNNSNDDQLVKTSRREFLKLVGLAAGSVVLGACGSSLAEKSTSTPARLPQEVPSKTTTSKIDYNNLNSESAASPEYDPANTVWNYDFSKIANGPLPSDFWNITVGTEQASYNNEAEVYTDRLKNVRVENGQLVIEAFAENYQGRSFTSARINTLDKFSFVYGSLEVDMMIPGGIGTWPAAWLFPRNNIYNPANYNINPNNRFYHQLNGEIDFMETIGRLVNQNWPAAHSYNSWNSPGEGTPIFVDVPDAYTEFHKYGLIKTPEKISFTLDGQIYSTVEKKSDSVLDWPYDQPYYLIIDSALGGSWAGGDPKYPPYGIDTANAPWQLRVKSIDYTPLQ